MRTNQRSQRCTNCGTMVAAGQGRLEHFSRDYLDDEDIFGLRPGWHVFCLDQTACSSRRAAAARAAEAARKAAEEFERRLATLFTNGVCDRPEPGKSWPFPDGQRIPLHGGFDVYGGGTEFVIAPDAIWKIDNNGSDGDCWSASNVGSGYIGRRFEATPERLAFLASFPGRTVPPEEMSLDDLLAEEGL